MSEFNLLFMSYDDKLQKLCETLVRDCYSIFHQNMVTGALGFNLDGD
jgi:hypothetical protein